MQRFHLRRALLSIQQQVIIPAGRLGSSVQIRHFQNGMRDYKSRSQRYSDYSSDSVDYLFGQTSVLLALQNEKRKPEKLFMQLRTSESQITTKRKDDGLLQEITRIANDMKIPIIRTDKGELNNMTQNRPHQGIVLQAAPLSTTELQSLPEDYDKKNKVAPLWIALDEIQDPQNLGSILRTAYFFGVDGIVICTKNSAPLSNIVSRVSAGALECMDIHSTRQLTKFLQSSKQNGWNIIGAAGQDAQSGYGQDKYLSLTTMLKSENAIDFQKPRVLVLGNEGVGLRRNVQACCDHFLGIDRLQQDNRIGSVDSLNVGVATGILISHLKGDK